MQTALRDLGVTDTTLSAEETAALDRDGYLPLHGVLNAAQVDAFNNRLARLTEEEAENAGIEVHQEQGADRLSDLYNKDPMFTLCMSVPKVLAAIHHVLGDFKVFSLNSRAAQPGQGQQALHTDYGEPVQPGHYRVCNSIWLLDDFTAENGATRVVPGKHRSAQLPGSVMDDPLADHPDQIQLVAPAGTVVVFNSHLWHGGTINRTDRPRRAMHGAFSSRDQAQQTDQQAYLRPETYARLSDAHRFLLDVVDPALAPSA